MRQQHKREWYIPENAAAVDCGNTDAVAYIYTKAGVLYGLAFHGKAQKPDWHYRFRSEEECAKAIARLIESRKGRREQMAKRKADQNQPSKLKVGDVLRCSWGYDQTNVDFYQVTAVVGATMVEARPIAEISRNTGDLCGRCKPDPDNFIGPARRYRVSHGDTIKTRGFGAYARPCGRDEETYWSAYA